MFSAQRDNVELLRNLKSPRSTPFNRMKAIWKEAAAVTDSSKTIFRWARNGQSVSMSCPRKGNQQIQMHNLIAVIQSSVCCLCEKLDALIPSSAGISLTDVQASIDGLGDDAESGKSFLFSESGSEVFSPLVERLYNALHPELHNENGKPDEEAIDLWLTKEQDLLGALAFAFSWNSGYPPRAFQTLDSRFNEVGSQKRNIYHISGLPVFAWPKSKGIWRRGTQTSLWVLPHAMGLPLYLYIAVIRQVQIKLMKELGRNTSLHRTKLFVYSSGGK
jgi:hypothetical protein